MRAVARAANAPAAPTAAATVAPPAVPAVPAEDKSIAVLPFADMSEKRDQEYFSDGLSEELIDRLARSRNLRVIARTSAFAFKGKNEDVRSIAAQLGVAYVLLGSVRKSGDVLRITAQLVRASDGNHLWSQTYDRDLADIFKVQDEIADAVARALEAVLADRPSQRGAKAPDVEAYNLVLQGDVYSNGPFERDAQRAEVSFKKAIALDPDYALPWVKLGSAVHAAGLPVVDAEERRQRAGAPGHRHGAAHRPRLDGRACGALPLSGAGRVSMGRRRAPSSIACAPSIRAMRCCCRSARRPSPASPATLTRPSRSSGRSSVRDPLNAAAVGTLAFYLLRPTTSRNRSRCFGASCR